MEASRIPTILEARADAILEEWLREQTATGAVRVRLIKADELRSQCRQFLALLVPALKDSQLRDKTGRLGDIASPAFAEVKDMLGRLSGARSEQGFTPSETATFVFSLKRPLFALLREQLGADSVRLFDEIWAATVLLDHLGLYTTEVYQKSRESVIARQQAEVLELSTPVVKLWDGILALPLIGTLDSTRTQVVMESLLQQIVDTGSEVAIIDITGVPTVDTLVAQHLMKTVAAARLMGVDCIISGVRPQIAQTIVHLGVAFGEIPTKSTLAAAFKLALRIIGSTADAGRAGDEPASARPVPRPQTD
jgi:rsbT co-antagonist protein RsbR